MSATMHHLWRTWNKVRCSLSNYAAHPDLLAKRLKAIARPESITFRKVDYLGMTLLVMANEDIGWELVSGGGFEKAELLALQGLVRPTDIALDVGGNIGIYATFFARRLGLGRVFSFEPIPLNAGLIEVNAALNHCENVEIERCAMSDFEGHSDFAEGKDSAYSSLRSTGRVSNATLRQVEVTTLDKWLARRKVRPTVLKIDVEGAELSVLRGAAQWLGDRAQRPRVMLVEANATNQSAYGTGPEELVGFARNLGYVAHSILSNGALVAEWPRPEAVEDVLFLADQSRRS
jgi:FkbM family methyltransferase